MGTKLKNVASRGIKKGGIPCIPPFYNSSYKSYSAQRNPMVLKEKFGLALLRTEQRTKAPASNHEPPRMTLFFWPKRAD